MTIANLVSPSTSPLRPNDSVEQALGHLLEVRLRHLPVVNDDGVLVGVVSEDDLLDATGPDAAVQSLLGPGFVTAAPDTHVFDVTRRMVEYDLTTLPVVEADGTYVGLVRRHDIFERFASMLATQQAGAILALEVDSRDYSVSRLAYVVEQTDAKILSFSSEPISPDGKIRVTMKLNVADTSRVRHVLEHHGYRVVAAFGELEGEGELLERVQEFMRYLEV